MHIHKIMSRAVVSRFSKLQSQLRNSGTLVVPPKVWRVIVQCQKHCTLTHTPTITYVVRGDLPAVINKFIVVLRRSKMVLRGAAQRFRI